MSSGWFCGAVGPPLGADRDAVRVDGADAGFGQAADRRVGVLRRVVDVRPVEQRRDAGVERLERADQVRDVDVLGAVLDADVVEHPGEVLVERAAREDAAHRRLPRVPVGVDEARHDDHRVASIGLGVSDSSSCRPISLIVPFSTSTSTAGDVTDVGSIEMM